MSEFNIAATVLSRGNDHLTQASRDKQAAPDATAMIGSGLATAFSAGMSLIHKQDVMNSTLYAQLAANGRFDRFTQAKEWYNEYITILANVGWLVTGFQFTENSLSNVSVSVDTVVLQFLTSYLDTAKVTVVKRLAKALSDEKDPAATIFNGSGARETNANFQLGICSPDPDGNVVFSVGAFTYTIEETITHPLFTTIKRGSATFNNAFQTMILNEQVYASVRDAIAAALDQGGYMELMKDIRLPAL